MTSRSVLEGERKQVTVLFADLKGSTELIADLDPEAARQLLDPALHHMMEAVHRYEGTVNQVLGDGIMALFGAPLAHEDHALRACYAALAMQAALRRYGEEVRGSHGLEMHMRVGLNSGEVVVRTISNDLHMDYSAVGQTTHLAARMEQLAPPGGIRLTSATLRLVDGLIQVQALGRFPVKGLPEPVEVFELTGASTIHRRLQAVAARGLTRFIGRQHELETLRQALEQAAAGHGQIVAIVGEAGVGKSRLVYEFTQADVSRTWLVLEGGSVSYGKATPYFPVLDLLRRYMHLEERDEARTIRAKVTGHVLTLDSVCPRRARRRGRAAAHAERWSTGYGNGKSGLSGALSSLPGGGADAGWPSGGGARPRRAHAGTYPRSTMNAATRRMPCTSSARLPHTATPRTPHWLKPTTSRPSLWLTSWGCAPSRPTATWVSARCMPS